MVIGCLRLSDVSIIYYLLCCQPASDVAENLGRFLVWNVLCTGHRNGFELIPMVEMETGHPVEGYLGSEFPAIYNYCRVMAA